MFYNIFYTPKAGKNKVHCQRCGLSIAKECWVEQPDGFHDLQYLCSNCIIIKNKEMMND